MKIRLIIVLLLALLLRVYRFGQVPVSLHGDEVGVGFNAWSILTLGVDEYGQKWPIALRADIPPLNFYLTAISMLIFGKTETAIRFPAVVYGLAMIVGVYFLGRKLFDTKTALLSSLWLAINPWHIQVSRIAHEASLGVLLQVMGTLGFVNGIRKPRWLIVAVGMWGVSLYAYHAPRLTTPLLILGCVWIFRKQLTGKVRLWLMWTGGVFLVMMIPLMVLVVSRPLNANRLAGISIFIREATLKLSRQEIPRSSKLATIIFHNPLVVYTLAIGSQYARYLDPTILFFDTSLLRYFQVSRVGLFYFWDIPFFLTGIYWLVGQGKDRQKVVLWWLAIAPLAGAITLGTPNVGRSLMLLPVWQMVVAVGVIKAWQRWRGVVVGSGVILMFEVSFFLHQYLVQSPFEFAEQWDYGMKQAVLFIEPRENEVAQIIFTDAFKQPYIFLLFYGDKSYSWISSVGGERHSFIGYKRLGKYEFRPIDWSKDSQLKNALIVGSSREIPPAVDGLQREVMSPSGEVMLRIVRT